MLRSGAGLTGRAEGSSFHAMLDEVRQRPAGETPSGLFRVLPEEGQPTGKKGVEHMSSKKVTGCTLVVPVCETARLEAQRDEIAQTLKDLVADIRDLAEKVRDGGVKKAELGTSLSDLRYWLKAARETELELDEIKRKTTGIVGSYGLDLEAARFEVRCRLDRLRACRGSD